MINGFGTGIDAVDPRPLARSDDGAARHLGVQLAREPAGHEGGPSAHGYAPDGTRWIDVADVGAWMAQDDPTASSEIPSPRARAVDLLLSALRGRDGLDLDHLRRRTGHILSAQALAPLLTERLVVRSGSRIALAEAGFPVSDAIVRHLVDRLAVEPKAD